MMENKFSPETSRPTSTSEGLEGGDEIKRNELLERAQKMVQDETELRVKRPLSYLGCVYKRSDIEEAIAAAEGVGVDVSELKGEMQRLEWDYFVREAKDFLQDHRKAKKEEGKLSPEIVETIREIIQNAEDAGADETDIVELNSQLNDLIGDA